MDILTSHLPVHLKLAEGRQNPLPIPFPRLYNKTGFIVNNSLSLTNKSSFTINRKTNNPGLKLGLTYRQKRITATKTGGSASNKKIKKRKTNKKVR